MLRDRILKKLEEEKLDRELRDKRTKAIRDRLMAKKIKTGHETVKQNVQGRAAAVKGEAARDPSNPTGRADPEMRGWLRGQSQDAIAQDASRKPNPKPEPKVDDSTQPSLASIIRKKIEEKRANVSENRFSKPPRRGRVDTGKWKRNGSRRGLLPLKNNGEGGNGGTPKSDDGVDAYKDNREEMGGPRT